MELDLQRDPEAGIGQDDGAACDLGCLVEESQVVLPRA